MCYAYLLDGMRHPFFYSTPTMNRMRIAISIATCVLPILTALAVIGHTRAFAQGQPASAPVTPPTPPVTPPQPITPPNPTVTPTPTPTPLPRPTPKPKPMPKVTVISPNGRETLTAGSQYLIRWSSTNVDRVMIGYSTGPGSLSWIAYYVPNTGSYRWTVNVGNTTNTQFKIVVIGYKFGVGSATDQSDGYFTVVQPKNTPPTVITSGMPPAKVNRWYFTTIEARDPDRLDRLAMTISGLPSGMRVWGCYKLWSPFTPNRYQCTAGGRTKVPGTYTVRAEARDNRGGVTTKTFSLLVAK